MQENAGINPLFYPRKVCLQLDDIELWNEPILVADTVPLGTNKSAEMHQMTHQYQPVLASKDKNTSRKGVCLSKNSLPFLTCPVGKCSISRVAFCYRDQRQIRQATCYDGKVIFDLSFHGLVFDVVKVNLFKKGFESHGKYAQAVIKLSQLECYKDGAHIVKFPLVEYRKKKRQIGSVSILLQFYDFVHHNDDSPSLLDPSLMTCEPEQFLPSPSCSTISNEFSFAGTSDDTSENQTENLSAISSTADSNRDTYTDTSDSFGSWKEDSELIHAFRSHSLSTMTYNQHDSGLAGLKSLAAGLMATGWKMSSKDMPRSLALMGRYYRAYSTPKTGDRVLDMEKLKEADYFLKFIMPIYGTIARKVFGHGSTADLIKKNKAVAIQHLGIKKNHMLAWEYTPSKMFAAKPSFYICYSEERQAVHLCIRGTFNIQDIFTDVNCEFVPFMGGTAHNGILQSALWIKDHYYEQIKAWIRQYKATSFYLCGHSLGGSIASILVMLIYHDITKEFPSLLWKVYSFAPAPCVSPDLIAAFEQYIESYINKHDPVPTLSYGAAMDLKEMLVHASKISNNSNLSKEEKLESLYEFATELRKSNKHPRLLVPGQIFFMYKTTDPKFSMFSKINGDGDGDEKQVGYVVERSIPEYFDHLHLKLDMMYHHFPSIYHNSLKKAIQELEKEAQLKSTLT